MKERGMGRGFNLTNEEALLVHKLVVDAITRSSDDTVWEEIGDEDAVRTAVRLYTRMADAMQGGRFP